jgi:hypothetical protein
MRIDFSQVVDVEEFVSVPEGVYPCRLRDVQESTTRDGSPRLWYRLEIDSGEHAGRVAAVDGINLTPRAMSHAKHVLSMLGFDVSGEVELTSEALEGRRVNVQVVLEEREDPVTGRRQVRARVPYRGYSAPDDDDGESVPWGDQQSA